jgi:hypothetical protein
VNEDELQHGGKFVGLPTLFPVTVKFLMNMASASSVTLEPPIARQHARRVPGTGDIPQSPLMARRRTRRRRRRPACAKHRPICAAGIDAAACSRGLCPCHRLVGAACYPWFGRQGHGKGKRLGSNAAARTGNQDAVTGLDPCLGDKPAPCGKPAKRQGRSLAEVQMIGLGGRGSRANLDLVRNGPDCVEKLRLEVSVVS